MVKVRRYASGNWGKRLRQLRNEQSLTVEDVAQKLLVLSD